MNHCENREMAGHLLPQRLTAAICAFGLLLWVAMGDPARASDKMQKTFASPQTAAEALVEAMRSDKTDDLIMILGPQSRDLVSSGDPVADKDAEEKFIAAYGEMNKIVSEGKSKALLVLGTDAWPFAVPLVKSGGAWRFDGAAGREEILDRRIGRNELNAIEVCRTYVQAQNEYARRDRLASGFQEYAQKFQSSPGKHDGLYWLAGPNEEESPLGPVVASARAEGYDPAAAASGTGRQPFHGYLYKILTRQGKAAPGGAHDYVVKDHMIGGFALVAFPARYGDSGIMTFIVSHDGVVYQNNLGPDTSAVANRMTEFNPDQGWEKP